MKKWVFGLGAGCLNDQKAGSASFWVSARELARMGIPARKIPRIQRELQKAADADPLLNERSALLRLARALNRVLP